MTLVVASFAMLAALLPAAASAQAPQPLWTSCDGGPWDVVCSAPRGVATSPQNGHVVVADTSNARIVELDAWGVLVRAWGWDVADAGDPGDTAPVNRFEICTTVCKAGTVGGGAGQFSFAPGVAVDSSGDVYVVDLSNRRVQKFSSSGQFLRMWGGDVSATGPGQAGVSEVQTVTVRASSGTFTLTFSGETTDAIPFDAPPGAVEAALQALPVTGGAASVSGGPGDAAGSNPYVVTLSGYDAPQMTINTSNLGVPVGTVLGCASSTAATTTTFQWLSDGAPATGPGAATNSYTTVAADAGKPVQCQVTKLNANAGSTQVSNPRTVVSDVPATAPPFAPSSNIVSPAVSGGTLAVGSDPAGAVKLTCTPGAWTDAASFSYRWFRNGVALVGNGADSSEYTVQPADLASAAVFQCAVTGSNAGGAVTKVSQNRATTAAPSPAAPGNNTGSPNATSSSPLVSSTATTTNGVAAAEICVAGVNTCKAGVQGVADGQFGAWVVGSYISITPDDKVYVGDPGRIQRFDTDGVYQDQIAVPGETVQSLATDTSGNFYVAYNGKADVRKLLGPAGTPACTIEGITAPRAIATGPTGEVYVFDGANTIAFPTNGVRRFDSACQETSVDAFGGLPDITVSSAIATSAGSPCFSGANHDIYVSKAVASPNGMLRAFGPPPDQLTGAGELCQPAEAAPTIADQYTASVDTDGAVVRAKIDPHFWADTRYFVQYGSVACVEGGWQSACVQETPVAPGLLLTDDVASADIATKGIALQGLEPDSEYRYRFVAQSSGGGPVFGEGDAACVLDPECGQGANFRTFPVDPAPGIDCPNQVFRTGASAGLPDCRAFEMVSPVDKNNGDVNEAGSNLIFEPSAVSRSTPGGDGLGYSSYRAFAGAAGAPKISEYVARRDPQRGWSSESISPPMTTGYPLALGIPSFEPQYRAFTDDLCHGWLFYDALPALTEDALEGYPNLHRRENCGAGKGSFEPLVGNEITPPPPPVGLTPEQFLLDMQGASENGHAIFRVAERLTSDAPAERYQLYERHPGGLRAVCVLPNETVVDQDCSAGTANETAIRGNTDTVILGGRTQGVENAISDDGSRIFWSSAAGLFVRIDGAKTVQISNASNVRFHSAAVDGSRTIFSEGGELRTFDVDKALALEDDPSGPDPVTAIASGLVHHILGASDDATRVYFASTAVLTGVPNSEGDTALNGVPNLYYHELGGDFQFIGTLAAGGGDAGDTLEGGRRPSPVNAFPAFRSAQVSAEGLHVAFNSYAPLTGFESVDQGNDEALAEVFAYDAQTDKLACVSCSRGGRRPVGRDMSSPSEGGESWMAAVLPRAPNQNYSRRPLSDDGSRLFFESFNPLVAGDTNGRQDVYEFTWTSEAAECETDGKLLLHSGDGDAWGCLALISTGRSATDSQFMDADRTGENVFIATDSTLVAQDRDTSRDAYVARVGGGFAPPPETAVCGVLAGACQGGDTGALDAQEKTSSAATDGEARQPARMRLSITVPSLAKAGRLAARRGLLRVSVRASRPGVVRVLARARIGSRVRRIAAGSRSLRGAGRATVTLRLNRAARKRLARGNALRVVLRASSAGARSRSMTVRLPGARS
jgi:hypothetical protein